MARDDSDAGFHAELRHASLHERIEGNAGKSGDGVARGHSIAALETVNQRLKDRAFVVGSDLTIADISMSAYQFYQEENGIDRSRYPHIHAWLERIASQPGWAHPYDLMPRAMTTTAITVGASNGAARE